MEATFPRPSTDVITLAKTDMLRAVLTYREEATIPAADGSSVRPSLAAALALIKAVKAKPRSKIAIPVEGNAVMAVREPLPGEVVS
jgi:hypothetical protein